jgi:hypothetical protein
VEHFNIERHQFSSGTPVSSTNKPTEILLKVALNTINLTEIHQPCHKLLLLFSTPVNRSVCVHVILTFLEVFNWYSFFTAHTYVLQHCKIVTWFHIS